jgi:hypothetical protein
MKSYCWTEAMGLRVMELASRGQSASVIARAISEEFRPTTRNAVLGFCFRHSIKLAGAPIFRVSKIPKTMIDFVRRLANDGNSVRLIVKKIGMTGVTASRSSVDRFCRANGIKLNSRRGPSGDKET